jgi:hypothetical protein
VEEIYSTNKFSPLKEPVALLLDRLGCHLSKSVREYLQKINIYIIPMPPKAGKDQNPLDNSLFSAFKTLYSRERDQSTKGKFQCAVSAWRKISGVSVRNCCTFCFSLKRNNEPLINFKKWRRMSRAAVLQSITNNPELVINLDKEETEVEKSIWNDINAADGDITKIPENLYLRDTFLRKKRTESKKNQNQKLVEESKQQELLNNYLSKLKKRKSPNKMDENSDNDVQFEKEIGERMEKQTKTKLQRGLPNNNRNCWGNSLAQILSILCPNEITSILQSKNIKNISEEVSAILKFFTIIEMICSNVEVTAKVSDEIWKEIREIVFKEVKNEIKDEDYHHLLSIIFRNETSFPEIYNKFMGIHYCSKQCNNCKKVWSHQEVIVLSLPISSINIPLGLQQYFQENDSQDNAVCSECKTKSTYIEKYQVTKNPQCLIIYVQPTASKDNAFIPLILKDPNFKQNYILKGIIFDYATEEEKNASHYDSLILYQNQWLFCNDDLIETIDLEEFLKNHLEFARPNAIFYEMEPN